MISIDQELISGLKALSLEPAPEKMEKLEQLFGLLQRWNKVFNLTTVTDQKGFVTLHILDSLTVRPFLQGNRILDVGTGAGFPGLPLAIFEPDRKFVLLDASAKKIRFVRQAVLELKLSHVEAIQSRVEQFQPREKFDTVVTRAFAQVAVGFDRCRHLIKPGGKFIAMKGKHPKTELETLAMANYQVKPVTVPGLEAERHLVEIEAPCTP